MLEVKTIYFKDEALRLGMTNINDVGDLEVWVYLICKQQNKDFEYEFKRIRSDINEQV